MAIPPTASLILPRQLPAASAVTATDMLVGDNGSVVQRVTPTQLVNAATPLASQAEAEAGTNNNNRMTPLRVAQAISFQAVASATLAADTGATLVGATGGITVQAELDGLKQADIDLQDGVDSAQADASAAISTANAASAAVGSVTGIANAALAAVDALSEDTGAASIGYADGSTVADVLEAQNKDVLYSSRFPTLTAAISAWMATGGELVINKDYLSETSIFGTGQGTFLAGKSYFLSTQGARKIAYTGSATHQAFHRWYASGAATLEINGDLTFEGNSLCGTCLLVDFTAISGPDRRDCLIRGVKTRNARLNIAFAQGANGLLVRGGFDMLHFDDCHATNVTRAAGTGVVGGYGSSGIQYFGTNLSTANAKNILIENGSVANVTSEDSPTTSAFEDMDGLLVFQYAIGGDPVAAPVIRNMTFRECAGRAIKRYATGLGGLTENITVERSVRGKFTGANDIAIQDGSGILRNVKVYLSGNANVVPSTPVVVGSSGTFESRGVTADTIYIEDTTGAPLAHVVSIFSSVQDALRRAYTFSNIVHTGIAPAFIRLGRNATTGDVNVTLNNINCSISQAIGTEDDQQQYLKVHCHNFVNRSGTLVPAKAQANGTMATINWGDWWGDDACQGVYRYVPVWRGNSGFKNGLRGPGGGCLDAPLRGQSEVFGRTPLLPVTIASGTTYNFPPFGSQQSNGGDFVAQIRRRDTGSTTYTVRAVPGSTALTEWIGTTPAGWSTLSTGAPSGGGTNIEVWKDSATQALRITNYSASSIVIELTFNP